MKRSQGEVSQSTESLQGFFHRRLLKAIEQQRVSTHDATVWYLCNLLADYSRSDRLFDYSEQGIALRPLAELYAGSVNATSKEEQALLLQRLGDVALFIAGLFGEFFNRPRRMVDLDYYIGMGESAYASLANSRNVARNEVFANLADQFNGFVRVLHHVGQPSGRTALFPGDEHIH